MKIGIIGAMDEEVAILKSAMNNITTTKVAGCEFYQGELNGKQIVLTKSGIGKVAAAVATTLLLEKFSPDSIINTGSAGGFDADLNVGDIVISTEVRFHDVDLTAFGYEIGQMAQLPPAFEATPSLISVAQQAAQTLPNLNIVQGLICTGDIFMADPAKTEIARTNFPSMMACEMEAAAIAQTCCQCNVPFIVVRVLSDLAGENSHTDFDTFVDDSSKKSATVVSHLLPILDVWT